MWHVCDEINNWFGNDTRRLQDIADALNERVKIIWYELEESVDCWEKFADLNVGKIPLTNSELIKALFMREDNKNNISEHDKSVIVDQWDSIERELNNRQFGNFSNYLGCAIGMRILPTNCITRLAIWSMSTIRRRCLALFLSTPGRRHIQN